MGPLQALAWLCQLCRQWLQPELYSKDQMLKLLLLEQLLGTLAPRDPGPLAGAAARQSRGSYYLGRQASLGARLASG